MSKISNKFKFDSSIHKLYTYDKTVVKSNIVIIESVLTKFKDLLNTYLIDINTLYENIDVDGFVLSYDSFQKVIKALINEFELNSDKILSNNSFTINFKIIKNENNIISIRKSSKFQNYELDDTITTVKSNNDDLNYLHFSNTENNIITLIIGNNNDDFDIKVGNVVLVKNTTNYNGFFKCKEIITKFKAGYIDGVYTFYADHVQDKLSEEYSQYAQAIIYNSPTEEITVGYNTTETRSYILSGDPTQTFDASSTNVSTLTLSCVTDGEITITTNGGILLDSTNFAVDNIVKIEGSQISSYNGYFRVKVAGNNTSCIVYGGSTTIYSVSALSAEITLSNNPLVIISNWLSGNIIDISTTQTIAISKNTDKIYNIGTALVTNTLTSSISQFDISEHNGIMTITLTNGQFASTTIFGDVIEIKNTTNFNGYYMVAESLTANSSSIKCYSGSKANLYADESLSSPHLYSKTYTNNQVPISIDTNTYKQYDLGLASITITADNEANSFLQFQNNIKYEIKLTIGKKCNSPNIAIGSFIKIENTTEYNGTWSIKSINTIHSTTSHGVYILDAPDLKLKKIEKYYSNAQILIYSSNKEYIPLTYNNICKPIPFIIKLSDTNKHNAFYIPGFTIYTDNTNIVDIIYSDNIAKMDVDDGNDKNTIYRISGKNIIPKNLAELKKIYKQIISSNTDLDKKNPNTEIKSIISTLITTTRSIASIKTASYL